MHKIKKISFRRIRVIAIDEVDEFFKIEQNLVELEQFYQAINTDSQIKVRKIFYSATYPDQVFDFVKNTLALGEYETHKIDEKNLTLSGIKQVYYVAKKHEDDMRGVNPKIRALIDIYNQFDGT